MSIKLKPSTKEYNRDSNGRMLNSYKWKHYPPSGFKTKDLLDMYKSSSYRRKKHLILIELKKRGAEIK